jgi:tetratricopeptide (TPR) repeat protein
MKKMDIKRLVITSLPLMICIVMYFLISSNSASTHLKPGYEYCSEKNYDRAIVELTKAIKLDPWCRDASVFRASAFDSKGEFAKAVTDYSKAIELDPKDAAAYNNRGYMLIKKKKYAQAIEDCTRSIELDFSCAIVYFNRASAYEAISKPGRAQQHCHQVVKIAEPIKDKGMIRAAKEKIEKIRMLGESSDARPDQFLSLPLGTRSKGPGICNKAINQ